jgi:alkylated DNA repair dioxygenase AlkB
MSAPASSENSNLTAIFSNLLLNTSHHSQNASEDFDTFVAELKTAKLRGDEFVRDVVQIINRYQSKYGDSEQELKKLAKAVGVHVATLYRWKAQVEGKKTAKTKPNKDLRESKLAHLVSQGVITAEEKETYLKVAAALAKKPEKPKENNPVDPKADPKFEYIPDYVTSDEGSAIIADLENSEGWVDKETGSCTVPPSHATIHFGPRQAYLDCVPKEYRATSAGEIPDFLLPLKARLEAQYGCIFNSAQINKHFSEKSVVHPHTDSNAGHICMLSLGAEREFILKSFAKGRSAFARPVLADRSLLTFFPKEQHKMTHEMPKSEARCGARYSIIFRHIQHVLTVPGNLTKKVRGTSAEKKAIRDQREAEYAAAQPQSGSQLEMYK